LRAASYDVLSCTRRHLSNPRARTVVGNLPEVRDAHVSIHSNALPKQSRIHLKGLIIYIYYMPSSSWYSHRPQRVQSYTLLPCRRPASDLVSPRCAASIECYGVLFLYSLGLSILNKRYAAQSYIELSTEHHLPLRQHETSNDNKVHLK
jgi:hypothetical protein